MGKKWEKMGQMRMEAVRFWWFCRKTLVEDVEATKKIRGFLVNLFDRMLILQYLRVWLDGLVMRLKRTGPTRDHQGVPVWLILKKLIFPNKTNGFEWGRQLQRKTPIKVPVIDLSCSYCQLVTWVYQTRLVLLPKYMDHQVARDGTSHT